MADRTQAVGGDSPYKLYKISVSGDDRATVRGYMTVEEVKALEERCKTAGGECTIEEEKFPVGLEAVLDEQDWGTAWDIHSILERQQEP